MSGFSTPESLLLLVIALVVLGPKRLPEIANKVGSWLGQARRMTRALKRQLEEELSLEEKPTIHTPVMPPPPASQAPGPLKVEEEPEPHIPNDDDTYSPLHSDDAQDEEKSA